MSCRILYQGYYSPPPISLLPPVTCGVQDYDSISSAAVSVKTDDVMSCLFVANNLFDINPCSEVVGEIDTGSLDLIGREILYG